MSGERWRPPPERRRPAAAATSRGVSKNINQGNGAQSIPTGSFVKPFDGSAATAVGFGGKPAAPRAKILRFTPYQNPAGTQLGFLDVQTPAGMIIRGCRLMVGPAGTKWIATPGNWRKGPNDEFVLGEDGKRIFDATVDFKDRITRNKFGDLVLEGLKRDHPELFEGGGGP